MPLRVVSLEKWAELNVLPGVRTVSLAAILALLVLAFTFSACFSQDEDVQPVNAQICFPDRSDILVSNSNAIPNMKIVETKTFVMVWDSGLGYTCEAATAFMEQVRHHGGNAVIGFSSMAIAGSTPINHIVFHGTAVVVEPVDN